MKVGKKLLNIVLCKFFFPLKNSFYEVFTNDFVLLSASVWPTNKNWGDDVSKTIVQLINPSKRVIIKRYSWNLKKKEDYLCVGSIITWMTTPNSIIWGSGVVYPDKDLSACPKRVLAVRGPLTRKYFLERGIECPEIYGDPALLFPKYYKPQVKKQYKYGIIPHYRDKNNVALSRLYGNPDVLLIDVQKTRPWTSFIDSINKCEFIFSSSLHGIIISDAYGVPNWWIELEKGENKRYAFLDYLLSVHRKQQFPIVVNSSMSIEDLLKECGDLDTPSIDTDKLLQVCPFI